MNPLGKTKKEEFDPEKARQIAAKAARKSNPLVPERKARKIAEKVEKKMDKSSKKGARF